jgi:hypothetical protein
LEGDVMLNEVLLENGRAFNKSVVDYPDGFQDFCSSFGRHSLCVDAVTVVVVQDKNL